MYDDPYNPKVRTQNKDDTKEAVRVKAHSESVPSPLTPMTRKEATPKFGKLGVDGTGQEK